MWQFKDGTPYWHSKMSEQMVGQMLRLDTMGMHNILRCPYSLCLSGPPSKVFQVCEGC